MQLFWAKVVRHRPASPDDPEIGEEDAAQRPESYAELLDAFDDYSHALATELERADPEADAWHWSGDSRVGTTYRRQAHEALIHRVDAELTAGVPVTPLDAALADDGVAEALGVMYGGAPEWGSFAPVRRDDRRAHDRHRHRPAGRARQVLRHRPRRRQDLRGRGRHRRSSTTGAEPVATVTGTAADLDTWLWKRDPALSPGWDDGDRIRIEGDRIVYEKLSAILGQPLN